MKLVTKIVDLSLNSFLVDHDMTLFVILLAVGLRNINKIFEWPQYYHDVFLHTKMPIPVSAISFIAACLVTFLKLSVAVLSYRLSFYSVVGCIRHSLITSNVLCLGMQKWNDCLTFAICFCGTLWNWFVFRVRRLPYKQFIKKLKSTLDKILYLY